VAAAVLARTAPATMEAKPDLTTRPAPEAAS